MHERLLQLIRQVGSPKVLLVGDFMLDRYLYGHTDRISPEAPVMVLNVTDRQLRAGGAGSVANDLVVLGGELACLGVVGEDANGGELLTLLSEMGRVNIDGLITVQDRPTTSKERLIGLAQHRHQQQLMRIDEESDRPLSSADESRLLNSLESSLDGCDVVCLEDYNKGVLTGSFGQAVIRRAKEKGKKVIVDPAAINDYSRYAGAWMVKPNRRELSLATGVSLEKSSDIHRACEQLSQQFQIDHLVVTLDKEGAFLYQADGNRGDLVPTRARDVYDVTGAGDMVLATLGVLVGGGYESIEPPSLAEVVYLANVAGGLEVERYGCVGISREEIGAELVREGRIETGKLRTLEALLSELMVQRQRGQKIVFTNGCFDILHSGHLDLLNFAKSQGDSLIVAINSDRSVTALKGPGRPINSQQERANLLGGLEAIDSVVIFDEETPIKMIEAISPDVLIKGADWKGNIVGQEWVEAHGGEVVVMPLTPDRSTTNIVNKILGNTDE
jgi:D-beta-D-heptose 7-phosphate kinase/D-beta-D-heptose 1-phosphate adenosyltransferase